MFSYADSSSLSSVMLSLCSDTVKRKDAAEGTHQDRNGRKKEESKDIWNSCWLALPLPIRQSNCHPPSPARLKQITEYWVGGRVEPTTLLSGWCSH